MARQRSPPNFSGPVQPAPGEMASLLSANSGTLWHWPHRPNLSNLDSGFSKFSRIQSFSFSRLINTSPISARLAPLALLDDESPKVRRSYISLTGSHQWKIGNVLAQKIGWTEGSEPPGWIGQASPSSLHLVAFAVETPSNWAHADLMKVRVGVTMDMERCGNNLPRWKCQKIPIDAHLRESL